MLMGLASRTHFFLFDSPPTIMSLLIFYFAPIAYDESWTKTLENLGFAPFLTFSIHKSKYLPNFLIELNIGKHTTDAISQYLKTHWFLK